MNHDELMLPYEWLSSGHSEQLWGAGPAHKQVAYTRLPRLPARDGSFDWLQPLPPGVEGMPLVYEGEIDVVAATAQLRQLSTEAAALSLEIPAAFARFIADEHLHGRVATTTGAYFELGQSLLPVPGHRGPARLLQFMFELGTAWYLLLQPDGRHRVVHANAAHEVPVDIHVCAGSFEEFIERFWIETTLWFAQRDGTPIEGALRAYLEAAQRA